MTGNADGDLLDVVVIGGGPCGMAAAVGLARCGRSVAVLERHPGPFGLPRAGHVDGEVMRVLQNLGAHERLVANATPYGDYTWYGGAGQILFVINAGERSTCHWYSDYTVYQPILEQGLLDAAEQLSSLHIRYGHEVVDLQQDDAGVTLQVAQSRYDADGARITSAASETVRALWVIAADGGPSPTRERLGIPRTEIPFDSEEWLIVDAEILKRWPQEGHGAQYCNPHRPAFETPLGRRHHRWEWSLLPGEAVRDFLKPETARELLAERGIGPDDARVVRQQVYKFESRTAERWRAGRVFLLGDAAHTMAPFMGQGMCAGVRDAANLSWKLDLVTKGTASESLLDTYEAERRPHTQTWADISRAVGQISCTIDPLAAAKRDAAFASGEAASVPPFPRLTSGLLYPTKGPFAEVVGDLFPQALVRADSSTRYWLFDDAVESTFLLVVGGPRAVLPSERAFVALEAVGGRLIDFTGTVASHARWWDVDGTYYSYFGGVGAGAVVVRPDRYVYGAATSSRELELVLEALVASLHSEVEEAMSDHAKRTVLSTTSLGARS